MLNALMDDDHRRDERIPVSLPISFANAEGVTRDISLSGICFEANGAFEIGQVVRFVIEFGNMGGNLALKCCGEIVRMGNRMGKTNVAVKILESVLEPV